MLWCPFIPLFFFFSTFLYLLNCSFVCTLFLAKSISSFSLLSYLSIDFIYLISSFFLFSFFLPFSFSGLLLSFLTFPSLLDPPSSCFSACPILHFLFFSFLFTHPLIPYLTTSFRFLTEGGGTYRGCRGSGEVGFDLVYIDKEGLQELVLSTPDAETRARIWDGYRYQYD